MLIDQLFTCVLQDEKENIHIYAITDLQTGEELSLMEALRRGLLDPNTGSYRYACTHTHTRAHTLQR